MLPVFGCVKMKSNCDVFVDAILTTNKNNKEQGKNKSKMRIKQKYGNKEYDSRSLIFLKKHQKQNMQKNKIVQIMQNYKK